MWLTSIWGAYQDGDAPEKMWTTGMAVFLELVLIEHMPFLLFSGNIHCMTLVWPVPDSSPEFTLKQLFLDNYYAPALTSLRHTAAAWLLSKYIMIQILDFC
jgi:hypothetical protein